MLKITPPKVHYFTIDIPVIEMNDGDTITLSSAQGLQALGKTANRIEGAVHLKGARVFVNGWNRNFVRLKPGALSKYAKTATGTPILFDHYGDNLLGSSSRMWAEKSDKNSKNADVLRQDMQLTEPLAKKILNLGIVPRFSIAMLELEDNVYRCSECGNNIMDWDKCKHWPGQITEDGSTVFVEMTSAEHGETSITFSPAVPGTEPGEISMSSFAEQLKDAKAKMFKKVESDADLQDDEEDEETEEESPDEDQADDGEEEPDEDEEEVDMSAEVESLKERVSELEAKLEGEKQNTAATKIAFQTVIDSLASEKIELLENLAELEAKLATNQDEQDVIELRKWRADKGLRGDEKDLLEKFKQNRDAYREAWSMAPDSMATKRVMGAPKQIEAVELSKTSMTAAELDRAATEMAAASGRSWDECWGELRNQQVSTKSETRHK